MSLVNCKKCGTLFRKKLRNICDRCLDTENESIIIITDFIETLSEQFVSIDLISEKTGISFDDIEELYKNARLISIANRMIINCKSCGAETKLINRKGHFCAKCSQKMLVGNTDRAPLNPTKVKVELKKFDKDIMHTNKVSDQEQVKFGFKKSLE